MTSLKQICHEPVVPLVLVGGGDDALVGQCGPGREEEVVGMVDQVGHRRSVDVGDPVQQKCSDFSSNNFTLIIKTYKNKKYYQNNKYTKTYKYIKIYTKKLFTIV